MKFFSRQFLVQAFKLPLWGQVAEEIPPQWLVTRLQTGELEMNRLGGLTMQTPWGVQSSAAGDYVLFFQDNSIGFEKPEKFEQDFKPVEASDLIAA
ncbi:hypothetical protein [Bradyrhizobium phage BDU-MI-1]|nr:hypothetical protein [Bradyrhizobium phage BDU-MI-1]